MCLCYSIQEAYSRHLDQVSDLAPIHLANADEFDKSTLYSRLVRKLFRAVRSSSAKRRFRSEEEMTHSGKVIREEFVPGAC